MFHEPGPPVADGKSWMLHGRPSFSDARHSSPFTGSLNQVPGGRHQTEKELLHKIELLSEYHARNVKALDRLRRSAPIEVWGKDTEPPMHHKAIGLSADNTRRHSSDSASSDDECRESNTFVAPRPVSRSRRGSIRVLASSGSSSNRQVTVVEPFRSMETHTIAWKRKIREQDERNLREAQEEEVAKVRDRERFLVALREGSEFSGVIARSNSMIARRRAKAAEAGAKEAEETRKSSEFKARSVHITDEDWQTIQDRQEIKRKQRAEIRKAQMASNSSLPSRMALHAHQRKATAAIDANVRRGREKGRDHAATASGKSTLPSEIREVLARKQRRWDRQLATAKRKKKPVVPQVLPMEQREIIHRKRAQERQQKDIKKGAEIRRSEIEEAKRLREKAFSAPAPVIPRTTYSFLVKTAAVRARLERERDEMRQETERRARRYARQQETSKALSEVIREINRDLGTELRRDTAQETERRGRESRKKYHRALRENRDRLEQATAHRPTLWERHDEDIRKEMAKRAALSSLAERVFKFGAAGGDGGQWKTGAAIDNIFDEEERAALGL